MGFESDAAIGGQQGAYHSAEILADHMGVLLANQAERDFRMGLAWQNSFKSCTCVTAPDAIHLAGGA